jgi:hypothetical protein
MKKMATILGFLAVSMLTFCSFAYAAAPPLGGVWKGTVDRINTTTCDSVRVTLVLSQCTNGGRLVRGTAKISTDSVPVVGYFSLIGNIGHISIDGDVETTTKHIIFSLSGIYVSSTPAKIQVSDMSFMAIDLNTYDTTSYIFDTFDLIKQ